MLPIWPISLPQQPLREGFSLRQSSNLLRSEGDSGIAKVRRRGAPRPVTFTCRFRMTDSQRETLAGFVSATLQDGALRFEMPHPVSGATVEVRIVPEGDALFSSVPRGLGWLVSMTFEVLP